MVSLRDCNPVGELRKVTKLRPILYCPTRWSSVYDMLKREAALREFITDVRFAQSILTMSAELLEERSRLLLGEHLWAGHRPLVTFET